MWLIKVKTFSCKAPQKIIWSATIFKIRFQAHCSIPYQQIPISKTCKAHLISQIFSIHGTFQFSPNDRQK